MKKRGKQKAVVEVTEKGIRIKADREAEIKHFKDLKRLRDSLLKRREETIG